MRINPKSPSDMVEEIQTSKSDSRAPSGRVHALVRLLTAEERLRRHDDALIAKAASKTPMEWGYLILCYPHQEKELRELAGVRDEYDEWWYARAVMKSIERHQPNVKTQQLGGGE
jgi:hypothetical protein